MLLVAGPKSLPEHLQASFTVPAKIPPSGALSVDSNILFPVSGQYLGRGDTVDVPDVPFTNCC